MNENEKISNSIKMNTILGDIQKIISTGIKENQIYELFNNNDFGSDWVFKLDFLSTFIYENYSASMYSQYITIFRKSKEVEEYYKKDLYDFSEDEVMSLLKLFRAKTYNSITNKYSLIRTYMQIAKKHNKGIISVPSGMLLKANKIKETICTYAQEERYCTRTELEEGLDRLNNPNDKIVFALIYEGVVGDKYYDLLNIQKKDVDLEARELTTPSGIKLNFSTHTQKIIEDALSQTTAVSFGGSGREYSIDTKSPYLLKGKLTKESNGNPIRYSGLNRKLDVIKREMEMDLITGNTVFRSGIMERIKLYEYWNNDNKRLTVRETGELLNKWHGFKDGGDMWRAVEVVREDIEKDLEKRGWRIG